MATFQGLEISALEYIDLSRFLIKLSMVTFFLVLIYNSELITPYQQKISITTRSNLNLKLYTDKPEEILKIFKKEEE